MRKILFLIALSLLSLGIITIVRGRSGMRTIEVGSHQLKVEMAVTGEQLTRGLSGRDSIGSDGMLFVLPERRVATFWMKDMRFGLDFVWIDGSQVIGLLPDISPQPGVADLNLDVFSSRVSVTHVLELPRGDIARLGIAVGDQLRY